MSLDGNAKSRESGMSLKKNAASRIRGESGLELKMEKTFVATQRQHGHALEVSCVSWWRFLSPLSLNLLAPGLPGDVLFLSVSRSFLGVSIYVLCRVVGRLF